jgi:DNA-binding NarL/FixJ family response regulator
MNSSYFEDCICQFIDSINLLDNLTKLQQVIAYRLAEGSSVSDISDELSLAKSTIYSHIYKSVNTLKRKQALWI